MEGGSSRRLSSRSPLMRSGSGPAPSYLSTPHAHRRVTDSPEMGLTAHQRIASARPSKPMPFLTTEHDLAFGLFIYGTTHELARARSPLLQQIRVLPAANTASSVVDSRESQQLDLPAQPAGFTLSS